MRKNFYIPFTHDLCVAAVLKCFRKKWLRRDVMTEINKFAGITRAELKSRSEGGHITVKLEIAEAIAFELENRMERLLSGDKDALELATVTVEPRPEGASGKIRDIATLCVFHQLFNHVAHLGLYKLLRARILPQQYASIPKKGQTGLAKYNARLLRRNRYGIRHVIKTDIKAAYASTKYSVVIDIVRSEMPRAKWLIALLEALARNSPTGSLIIGGYLDAWLFNLVMSYVMRYAYSITTARRGKITRSAAAVTSFMDDVAYFGSRKASVMSVINKVAKLLQSRYGLTLKLKESTPLLTAEEERRRRKLDSPAQRGCPAIDMGGYRVRRTYVTIRKMIFLRIRRNFLAAAREIREYGYLREFRARRLASYNGYFKHTDSRHIRKELNVAELVAKSKAAISRADRRRKLKKGA